MPNAHTHDRIAVYAALPIAVATGATLVALDESLLHAIGGAVMLTVTHLVASYWLSPDLDLDSAIDNRWGILRWLWLPYQKLVPHRSWLSHSGVGGLIRIGYLCVIITLLLMLLDIAVPGILSHGRRAAWWVWDVAHSHPRDTALIVVGIICADMLHVIADLLSTRSKRIKRTLRRLLPRWLYRRLIV